MLQDVSTMSECARESVAEFDGLSALPRETGRRMNQGALRTIDALCPIRSVMRLRAGKASSEVRDSTQ